MDLESGIVVVDDPQFFGRCSVVGQPSAHLPFTQPVVGMVSACGRARTSPWFQVAPETLCSLRWVCFGVQQHINPKGVVALLT